MCYHRRMSRWKWPFRLSLYVGLGVAAQLIWGSYPPAAKRALQEVPKFSLLFLGTGASALAGLWLMWREETRAPREIWRFLTGEKAMWALAVVVALRSLSNIFAIDFTRATWVQLVYLMTPFAVAILGALFFGEPTPPYTYQALVLSSVGAALTLVRDWSDVRAGFTSRDFIGLGLAVLSMLLLSLYFQLVRRNSRRDAGRGMIIAQQGLAMMTTYAILSTATGESWSAWLHLSAAGWGVVLWLVFGIFTLGNVLQVTALGGANAALITSLMPLRLVSAVALGWLLLGERLSTPLQWLGAVLVLLTVSAYLWMQSRRG